MQLKTINNRYEVVRELGQGGMGDVHLVKDLHLDGRLLALKTIRPRAMTDASLERFRVEFKGLSQLSHPNIAAAHDFGRIAGTETHFFTSAFVDGVDVFTGTSTASLDQLLDVFAQALRGIDFIHTHGFLHNDLKPLNILLEKLSPEVEDHRDGLPALERSVFGAAGKVKIIDFGLVSAEHATFDQVIGTPLFLSPERIRLQPVDRRSDLYSLGLVFYMLCARVPPFREKKLQALLRMHLEAEPVQLAQFRNDLPPTVAELICRLTRKDPADRFESAARALEFLGSELRREVLHAATPLSTPEIASGKLLRRGFELWFLENCFRGISEHSLTDCCAAVLGPAGIGKTRLVRELRSLVQVSGGAYLEVGGTAVEGHLLPVLDVILRGLETSGLEGATGLRDRPPACSDSTSLSEVIEKVLLESAARIPIILVFDDFQDASETVRRFALELVHTTSQSLRQKTASPRLFIVISSRTQSARRPYWAGTATVSLTPFDAKASADFLKSVFEQDDIPESVLSSLTRIADGNPGLLLEVANDLAGKNHIQHNGSRWVFPASIAGIPLLESLPACIAARVASLDAESKALCECLSVSSAPLPASVLAGCLLSTEADVQLRLETLVTKGILVLEDPRLPGKAAGPAVEEEVPRAYSLACAGTRKFIAATLDGDRSLFLHRRIAQTLEDEGGAAAPDAVTAEALAHHWLAAGNNAGFLRYAQAAAHSLHRGGNLSLAADYQRRIVDGMPADAIARKLQALAKLSEAHELLWDLEKSKNDVERILSLGRNLLKPADRSALWRRIAALELGLSRNHAALAALDKARQALGTNAELFTGLALDAAEAWAAWCEGQSERSLAALARAEQALGALQPVEARHRAVVAGALNHLGNLHQVHGRLARAAETFGEQLTLLAGLNLPQAEAATHCSYGGVLLDCGRPGEALAELTLALGMARTTGDLRTLCRTRDRLGEHYLRYGDLKSALAVTEAALEDAEAMRNPTATANSLRTLGRIYLRAGRMQDASALLARALELHSAAWDRAGTPISRLAVASLAVQEGRLADALKHAVEAGEEAERDGLALARGLSTLVRAEVDLLESRGIDPVLVGSAEATLRSCGYLGELQEARLLSARGALAAGNAAGAAQILSSIDLVAGSLESSARAEYLQALVEVALGRPSRAARELRHLRQQARNRVLPALEADCDRALAGLREVPERLPTA